MIMIYYLNLKGIEVCRTQKELTFWLMSRLVFFSSKAEAGAAIMATTQATFFIIFGSVFLFFQSIEENK